MTRQPMTDVNELLRRVLLVAKTGRQYEMVVTGHEGPAPPHPDIEEADLYLDSLEQGPPPISLEGRVADMAATIGGEMSRLDSLEATITNIDIEWKALGKDFEAQWERVERIEKVLRGLVSELSSQSHAASVNSRSLDATFLAFVRELTDLAPPSNTQHPSRPHHPVQRPSNKKDNSPVRARSR